MRKLSTHVAFALVIMVLCISACNRRFGYGGGAAAPPPPPKVSYKMAPTVTASRYAPLENQFKLIASSEAAEAHNTIMEVLEMCESGEVSVKVYHVDAEKIVFDATIREYLETLLETKYYGDEIEELSYNDEGKITFISLSRF